MSITHIFIWYAWDLIQWPVQKHNFPHLSVDDSVKDVLMGILKSDLLGVAAAVIHEGRITIGIVDVKWNKSVYKSILVNFGQKKWRLHISTSLNHM